MCTYLLFVLDAAELRDPVNVAVFLTKLLPLQISKQILDIRIIIQIIIQCYQCSCLIQLCGSSLSLNEVRILTTGDHGTHSFICSLSGQPGLFYFGAYLLCDQLLHFIVVIDLRSRYPKKCGELFDTCCFFCGTVGSCARCTISGCLVTVTATSGEQCRCHC